MLKIANTKPKISTLERFFGFDNLEILFRHFRTMGGWGFRTVVPATAYALF